MNAAIHAQHDSDREASVCSQHKPSLDSARLSKTSSKVLPGYGIRAARVERTSDMGERGEIDFTVVEVVIEVQDSAASEQAPVVPTSTRTRVLDRQQQRLLPIGRELAFGMLECFVPKQMRASVAVAGAFTNLTNEGIALLCRLSSAVRIPDTGEQDGMDMGGMVTFADSSGLMLGCDCDTEPKEKTRAELSMVVLIQIIPMPSFCPVRAAYKCTSSLLPLYALVLMEMPQGVILRPCRLLEAQRLAPLRDHGHAILVVHLLLAAILPNRLIVWRCKSEQFNRVMLK